MTSSSAKNLGCLMCRRRQALRCSLFKALLVISYLPAWASRWAKVSQLAYSWQLTHPPLTEIVVKTRCYDTYDYKGTSLY